MFKNYLFPRSRMKYVTKNHEKELKDKGCTFCRIARNDSTIEKKVLYKDDLVMVVMNIYPYNVGHIQVIPIRHVVWLDELKDDEKEALFSMIDKAAKMIKKSENPAAMNIGLNICGDYAGASIMHLHAHIVPRYKRDFSFMETIADTRVVSEPIESTFTRLKKHVKMLE